MAGPALNRMAGISKGHWKPRTAAFARGDESCSRRTCRPEVECLMLLLAGRIALLIILALIIVALF